MDIQLAQLKEQSLARQDQLKLLIAQKRQHFKELLGQNASVIELMNIQLENLRLEFVQEQIRHSESKELRLANAKYVCCDCLVVEQQEPIQSDSSIKTYSELFLVKDTVDFYQKWDQIEKRNSELGYCGCDCCNQLAKTLLFQVKECMGEFMSIVCFFVTGFFLLYLLILLLWMPCYLSYNCIRGLANGCYRRDKRTNRIYRIYKKYTQLLSQVYMT